MPKKEALEMAIEALEQEPCEDAISRQATLNYIRDNYRRWFINDDAFTQCVNGIKDIAPVTPQPKTGHWIPTYGNVKCSVCGSVKDSREVGSATHYCDFCGAKMVESQESEDKE